MKRSSREICSLTLVLVLVFSAPLGLAQESANQHKAKAAPTAKNLAQEQKVSHLLDRITFGARPGEVERVMRLGWERYLDEQLHPERIADQALEGRLKAIESIHLSNAELARNYPPPAVIREVLQQRGIELPGFNANQGQPQNAPQNEPNQKIAKRDAKQGFKQLGKDARQMKPGEIDEQAMEAAAPKRQANAGDVAKRREAYQALKEMGYKPQQEIVQELQQAKILRAVYSEKQLQEVMTDFWFNHFNVYMQKGADRVLTTSYERDVIRPNVFGKFEDLLRATAESPAMLFYLDNWMSASPNAKMPNRDELRQMRRDRDLNGLDNRGENGRGRRAGLFGQVARQQLPNNQMPQDGAQAMLNNNGKLPRRRGLNENYAREIMELHTLGVDGGYTQKDVQEVARAFTGWTLRQPRGGGDFYFAPFLHDDGEKMVLGQKIAAGGGVKDGYNVIHILATHPATAKFISTKLARKFVADNPPPALVERMAATFRKTAGDIRQVLRTMFTSPELFAAENYRAKIKTPFEMTVSAVRALNADTNGGPQFHRWLAQMGEGLFMAQPPTGYPDTAEHWVNTGALLARMNFALALAGNKIPGTRVNLKTQLPGTNAASATQTVDHYAALLLRGQVSPQTRATIDKSLSEQQPTRANGQVDVAKVVGLIMGSPEFQRQ